MNVSGLRTTLKAGSLIFGSSSLILVLLPNLFLQLLALQETEPLAWSMRMIGITVFALAGNIWQNSKHQEELRVRYTAIVMAIAAFLLGVITLSIPTEITLFAVLYSAVGFGFCLAYLINLFRNARVD